MSTVATDVVSSPTGVSDKKLKLRKTVGKLCENDKQNSATMSSSHDFILRRSTSWRCPACLRESVDARRVCGFCLAVEPSVFLEKQRDNKSNKTNGFQGNNKINNIGGNLDNYGFIHNCIDPAVVLQTKSHTRLLHLPHGRCYRVFDANKDTSFTDKSKVDTNACAFFCNMHERERGKKEEKGTGSETETGKKYNIVDKGIKCKEGSSSSNSGFVRKIHVRGVIYTHFVSLPIGSLASVLPNATMLLEKIRNCCVNSAAMVTEDIFTTAPRMHITLLMLSLLTSEVIALAVDCMHTLERKIKLWIKTHKKITETSDDNWRPQIHLGGLHVMKNRDNSEKKADVLYMGVADVSSGAILETLQGLVYESFAELIANDTSQVEKGKLFHVTLINTKWREEKKGENDDDKKKKMKNKKKDKNAFETSVKFSSRVPFDATHILREFGGTSLCGGGENGAIDLERVDLNALNYNAELQSYPCEYSIIL